MRLNPVSLIGHRRNGGKPSLGAYLHVQHASFVEVDVCLKDAGPVSSARGNRADYALWPELVVQLFALPTVEAHRICVKARANPVGIFDT